MELSSFVRHAVRRWYIFAVLLFAALGGTTLYHVLTYQAKATALVTVLRPFVAAPGEYLPPQITFEALDESSELSERVAARLNDGTTGKDIKARLTIDIRVSTKPTLTPLYEISYRDRSQDRALSVANIAKDEATKLFAEINLPATRNVRAAFANELAEAQNDATAARERLAQFEIENNASNLVARRDQARGFVSELTILKLQVESGREPTTASSGSASVAAARAELERLKGLQEEYDRLKTESDLALAELYRSENRLSDLTGVDGANARTDALIASAREQLSKAQARYSQAQAALARFRVNNDAADVNASYTAQVRLVSQITLAETAARASAASVDEELAKAQEELGRLERLQPAYAELALASQRAESQLARLEQRVLDVIGGQTLPAQSEVKPLDEATIQTNLFLFVVTYGLAILLATFAAATIVYLMALFERVPPTTREIEAAVGAPVLAHVKAPPERR